MIGAVLSLALLAGGEWDIDSVHRATWYGEQCQKTTEFGRDDTCSPYVSVEDGGRGGELEWYAAAGWYRFGMPTTYAVVTSLVTGRSVWVTVRDYCHACHEGDAIIDLSPRAFSALWRDGEPDRTTLGIGVAYVQIRYVGGR